MSDYITPRQFMDSEGVEDWRLLSEGALALFRTGSFAESARFVAAIAELPGLDRRRPDRGWPARTETRRRAPRRRDRPDGGGAIHIGVWVAAEQAEARIAAALAAGGRMVRDDFAPARWTLADPAGNEADIATVTGRA